MESSFFWGLHLSHISGRYVASTGFKKVSLSFRVKRDLKICFLIQRVNVGRGFLRVSVTQDGCSRRSILLTV